MGIKLQNICKSFQTLEKRVDVLKGIDLAIKDKAMLVVFGPSGIGKTTLLNIIGGMDRPTSGKVAIDGVDLSILEPIRLANLRKEKIGFIFQDFNLIPNLKAIDNIQLAVMLDSDLEKKTKSVYKYADEIGIKDRLEHLPKELSSGEQQRVAIIRAIINSPSIILADEPTADLDQENSNKIIDILKGLNQRRGCTIIVATNDERTASCFPTRFTLT